MPYGRTTRSIKRQAIQTIHHPPSARDRVTVSKENQPEKAKMVKELIPFLMYLYRKHLDAKITEDMAVLQFEDINIPISVGDTILGGKFKNKRIVVKSIGKNEKGDITINGKPLLKYRTLDEATKRDYKKEYEKYGKSEKAKKYRAELNKYNRDKGTYGNGDEKDASHKGGKIVGFEDQSKNRGRREKSRLKKETTMSKLEAVLADKIECNNCGWTWMKKDGGDDLYICHKCGHDNQRYDNADKSYKRLNVGESTLNEFGGTLFHLVGFDSNNKPIQKIIKRASNNFMKDVAKYGSEKLFKSGKNVEYVKIYYDKTHLATVKDSGRKIVKEKGWKKLPINEACWKGYKQVGGKKKNGKMVPNCVPINEIPMGDLQKIDQFADKKLNPVDVVLTDKHFFDRLNDPRNGKEISQAELIGFFKRLSKKKKEFVEFLNQYNSLVAVDDRTNINIPFMKQANKAIAKTVMRKKDFKTPDKKLDI